MQNSVVRLFTRNIDIYIYICDQLEKQPTNSRHLIYYTYLLYKNTHTHTTFNSLLDCNRHAHTHTHTLVAKVFGGTHARTRYSISPGESALSQGELFHPVNGSSISPPPETNSTRTALGRYIFTTHTHTHSTTVLVRGGVGELGSGGNHMYT